MWGMYRKIQTCFLWRIISNSKLVIRNVILKHIIIIKLLKNKSKKITQLFTFSLNEWPKIHTHTHTHTHMPHRNSTPRRLIRSRRVPSLSSLSFSPFSRHAPKRAIDCGILWPPPISSSSLPPLHLLSSLPAPEILQRHLVAPAIRRLASIFCRAVLVVYTCIGTCTTRLPRAGENSDLTPRRRGD